MQPVLGLGFRSSSIEGIDHDALWLAFLNEVRQPAADIHFRREAGSDPEADTRLALVICDTSSSDDEGYDDVGELLTCTGSDDPSNFVPFYYVERVNTILKNPYRHEMYRKKRP